MKRILALLLITLPLSGCGEPFSVVAGSWLGLQAAAIPVIHRTVTDAAVSVVTGRDCSVVNLDRGATYCRPVEAPPNIPPYCTRSIGTPDCWFDTRNLGSPSPRGIADGPYGLTPEQNENRTRRWGQLF